MANLRNIKNRISSIKNTQKITRAMKMVAAAKVKKAEAAVKLSRPFTYELFRMFIKTYDEIKDGTYGGFEAIKVKNAIDNYPELLNERDVNTVALVVISSNKGLAGAYSANIVRFTLNKIKELNAQNKRVSLYLVGQKTVAPLKNAKKNLDFEIKEIYTGILDDLSVSSAKIVAEDLAIDYVEKRVDRIELITTRYINTMTYKVEEWTLLPAMSPKEGQEKARQMQVNKFHREEFDKEHNVEYEHSIKLDSLMEFLPNPKAVLQKIVPMYITNVIYQTMLEAQASELSSRMTAMSAATNNAEDMIKTLTVQYNKVRQEGITQELTEVIGASMKK